MNNYIKINEEYKPVTYIVRPVDTTWEQRKSIEIKVPEAGYEDVLEYFKNGKWSLFERVEKTVYDEKESDEAPTTSHIEIEYKETDMSEYCVCGWVRNNLDGSCSVKMGVLSELEAFMASVLGGI